jgi:hypothetical protein
VRARIFQSTKKGAVAVVIYRYIFSCGSFAWHARAVSEYRTRKEKVDLLLKKSGWTVNDETHVVIEVDTKQSDFRKGNYKTVKETLHDPNADKKARALFRSDEDRR